MSRLCVAFHNTQGITTSVNSYTIQKTKKINYIYLSECMLSPKQKEPNIDGFYLLHRTDLLSTNSNKNRNTILIYGNINNQYMNYKLTIIESNIERGFIITKIDNLFFIFIYFNPNIPSPYIISTLNYIFSLTNYDDALLFGDFNCNSLIKGKYNDVNDFIKEYELLRKDLINSDISFFNSRGSSCVDHLFTSVNIYDKINGPMVEKDINCSDHEFIYFDIILDSPKVNIEKNVRLKWNLNKTIESSETYIYIKQFSTEVISKRFEKLNEKILEDLQYVQYRVNIKENIDIYSEIFFDIIRDTAEIWIGNKKDKIKIRSFMSLEMIRIKMELKKCQNFLSRYRRGKSELRIFNKYKALKQEMKFLIYERKKELFREYIIKVSNKPICEQLKICRNIKNSSKRDYNYNLEDLNKFSDFYYNRFNHEENEPAILKTPSIRTYVRDELVNDTPEFSSNTIESIITTMPNNKAPGPSKLPIELFKFWVKPVSFTLSLFFQLIWKNQYTPKNWNLSLIYPLYKKKGSKNDPINYRPIALTEHIRKVFEKIILRYLKNKTIELYDFQVGFQDRRCTIDLAILLDYYIKLEIRKRKIDKLSCVAFLDIYGAFDTVDRRILWKKLFKYVPLKLLNILRSLFDNNYIKVAIGNLLSKEIYLRGGVLQGSILSPFLYLVFINDIKDYLEKETISYPKVNDIFNIRPNKLPLFMFADDIAIYAKDPNQLQLYLNAASRHAEDNNYKFNAAKTVILTNNSFNFKMDGEEITCSKTFEYLGITFNIKGIDSKSHLEKLYKRMLSLKCINIFGFNDYGLPFKSRIIIYKSIIRPVMEYGLNICRFNKSQIKKLESIQNHFMTKLLSVGINTNRILLLSLLNVEEMSFRIFILKAKLLYRLKNLIKIPKFVNYMPSLLIKNNIYILNGKEEVEETSNLNYKEIKTQFKIKRKNQMEAIWNSLQNPPIPSPVSFYTKYPKKILPILVLDSSRSLRMLLINKYPGSPVKCKLCHIVIHSYLQHRSKCLALPEELYEKFLQIDQIKVIDWINLERKTLCDIVIDIMRTFSD